MKKERDKSTFFLFQSKRPTNDDVGKVKQETYVRSDFEERKGEFPEFVHAEIQCSIPNQIGEFQQLQKKTTTPLRRGRQEEQEKR
jgi:hypothetical protein